MAVVELSRMMNVMSWASLTALEIASCPEWKKVESPMNTTCLFVMNGSMPEPVPAPSPMPERLCISGVFGGYISMV